MNLVPLLVMLLIVAVIVAVGLWLAWRSSDADKELWEGKAIHYRNCMTDAQDELDSLKRRFVDQERINELDRLEHRKLEDAVREKLANPRVSWSKVAEQFSYLKVANDESGT
jgi:predicted negative regulator of RcsB-dependent stress response